MKPDTPAAPIEALDGVLQFIVKSVPASAVGNSVSTVIDTSADAEHPVAVSVTVNVYVPAVVPVAVMPSIAPVRVPPAEAVHAYVTPVVALPVPSNDAVKLLQSITNGPFTATAGFVNDQVYLTLQFSVLPQLSVTKTLNVCVLIQLLV